MLVTVVWLTAASRLQSRSASCEAPKRSQITDVRRLECCDIALSAFTLRNEIRAASPGEWTSTSRAKELIGCKPRVPSVSVRPRVNDGQSVMEADGDVVDRRAGCSGVEHLPRVLDQVA